MNSPKQLKNSIPVGYALIAASTLCLIFAFICIIFLSFPSMASASSLPTKIWEKEQSRVLLPDWSQITFSSLPAVASSGSSGDRRWQAGTSVDNILKLGDINDVKPEILSLQGIEQLALGGINLENISLSAFPLAGKQTVGHLAEIVPNLGQFQLRDVPPIASLSSQIAGVNPNINQLPIGQAVKQLPQLAQAKLNQIDLSEFALAQIPNLNSVNLEQFSGWSEELISNIPLLSQVPLSSFPVPIASIGSTIMRIDMIYSRYESKRNNTISGSDVEGFAVACEKDCAYIELDDMENAGRHATGPLEGKQWISGKYQEVRGGSGCLSGWEPTGRHPFGEVFKVVVMEPSETSDTVDTALYFRFSLPCGKSPYIIGPVPFLSYSVNSPMFVGRLEGGSSNSISRSKGVASETKPSKPLSSNQAKKNALPTQPVPESKRECARPATYVNGVDVASLGEALAKLSEGIANLENTASGDYEAIGEMVCTEGSRNCGRAIGRYQLMSYREEVQRAVSSIPGGANFILNVNKGQKPTREELFQYFPPAVQDKLLQNSLAENLVSSQQEIDPKTGQVFKGDRLIERVAQKHFGGSGSKIDASYSNILGGYSLKQYGEKVREVYNHNTSDNCQANSGDSNGISNSVGSGITLNASWSIKVALFISSFLVGTWFLIRLFHKRKQQIFLMLIALGLAVTLGTAVLSH